MNRKLSIDRELDGMESPADVKTVSWQVPGGKLRCDLREVHQLACSIDRLSLAAQRLRGLDADQLAGEARRLSDRLGYLLEPLEVIETDRVANTVQVRSAPPTALEDSVSYYELTGRSGALTLVRYHRTSGQPRQRVPIQVTREVLERLVNDFAAVSE